MSSKFTIRARRAILEIYLLVVTRNTNKGAESSVAALVFSIFTWIWIPWVSMSRLIDPLYGAPCFSFYRPRENEGYNEGKEKNQREKKAFRIVGSFFSFMCVPLTQ